MPTGSNFKGVYKTTMEMNFVYKGILWEEKNLQARIKPEPAERIFLKEKKKKKAGMLSWL